MNNLASLKSELLYEYSQEEHRQWLKSNFYQHHNLPSRSLARTVEGRQHPNITARSKPPPQVFPIKGRELFMVDPSQPGPGSYQPTLRKHSSHCYIRKEEQHLLQKAAKKLHRKQVINECRGPGLYQPEESWKVTSRCRAQTMGKFGGSSQRRLLLGEQERAQVHLVGQQGELDVPSPTAYSPTKNKTSTFQSPVQHRMSVTHRSSLIRADNSGSRLSMQGQVLVFTRQTGFRKSLSCRRRSKG